MVFFTLTFNFPLHFSLSALFPYAPTLSVCLSACSSYVYFCGALSYPQYHFLPFHGLLWSLTAYTHLYT